MSKHRGRTWSFDCDDILEAEGEVVRYWEAESKVCWMSAILELRLLMSDPR